MNKLWGNKDDELKQQFILQFQKEVAKLDLLKGQLEINKAEASNPTRKWVTWRELLGYVLVVAVSWQWILQPWVVVLGQAMGFHPDYTHWPQMDMSSALYILGVMLGADLSPVIAERLKIKK